MAAAERLNHGNKEKPGNESPALSFTKDLGGVQAGRCVF
jgi:hypothetical protein